MKISKNGLIVFDEGNKKISLGIKQLKDNPWSKVEEKYNVGDTFDGSINNILSTGFYVQIDDDIEGFVSNSNISWTRKIKSPSDLFKQNDTVKVKLLEISTEDKKIVLGIKQLMEDPWESISDHVKENDNV